MKQKTLENK